MTFLHLPPDAFLETPWRNGGGLTRQIAIHPPSATVAEPFLWRVSTARVGSSGPFSPFPGLDRTLLLLAGDGLDLDLGPEGRHRLEACFEPVAFRGDSPATGTLLGGPCADFNVFTRRGQCRHDLQVLRAPASVPPAEPTLLFAAQGRARVEGFGDLLEGHALLATGLPLSVAPRPGGVLLAVRILPA